jgi:adenylyltransferase/sulfurtransferase
VKLCGRNATQIAPPPGVSIDLTRLADRLAGVVDEIQLTPHLLRLTVEGCRLSVFRGGRTLVFGVDDPRRARVLYDRYVGAG